MRLKSGSAREPSVFYRIEWPSDGLLQAHIRPLPVGDRRVLIADPFRSASLLSGGGPQDNGGSWHSHRVASEKPRDLRRLRSNSLVQER